MHSRNPLWASWFRTKNMKYIAFTLVFVVIIGAVVAWKVYEYRDCKNVGHSTFYCVMKSGK